MDDSAKNKAAISEEIITEVPRDVLEVIPVMAKVDMISDEIQFYDRIVKYALSVIPLIVNPNNTTDKDK